MSQDLLDFNKDTNKVETNNTTNNHFKKTDSPFQNKNKKSRNVGKTPIDKHNIIIHQINSNNGSIISFEISKKIHSNPVKLCNSHISNYQKYIKNTKSIKESPRDKNKPLPLSVEAIKQSISIISSINTRSKSNNTSKEGEHRLKCVKYQNSNKLRNKLFTNAFGKHNSDKSETTTFMNTLTKNDPVANLTMDYNTNTVLISNSFNIFKSNNNIGICTTHSSGNGNAKKTKNKSISLMDLSQIKNSGFFDQNKIDSSDNINNINYINHQDFFHKYKLNSTKNSQTKHLINRDKLNIFKNSILNCDSTVDNNNKCIPTLEKRIHTIKHEIFNLECGIQDFEKELENCRKFL